MSKGGFMKDALVLFAITLIAGGCLGGVYGITKEPIARAEQAAKEAAYKTVLPDATSFEMGDFTTALEQGNAAIAGLGYGKATISECVTGLDAGGNQVGHVVIASSKEGYGGTITVSVGISTDGKVTGLEFLTLAETVGFGMNADTPEWKANYYGKSADSYVITKTEASADNEINAISGATITSNAVNGAINAAVYFAKNCLTQ